MKTFHIKFYEHRKIYFAISLGLIAIGIIFNIILGTQLNIQFTGGAVIKYSYVGDIDTETVQSIVKESTGKNVSVVINKDVKSSSGDALVNNVTFSFAGTDALTVDQQQKLADDLTAEYPDAQFEVTESSSVEATMGQKFFLKCMTAVAITVILLIVYVGLRFRKIGGLSAGCMSVLALVHDVLIAYFVFVIFQIPINDSFIAVALTLLGYSLNNTIVVFDRVRENKRIMGTKAGYSELVNTSINQTLLRSLFTSLTTFIVLASIFVVGTIYNLSSVTTFALPMMVGIVVGCFSSVCISGPLYVMWQNHKAKKKAEAKG